MPQSWEGNTTLPQSTVKLGGQYQKLIDANPYRNQSYSESPWQAFLSGLGFRTQADAWKENMSVQAAEYDAAVAQKAFDTEYNDPQSQVERMKAAGLNPDIDPGSIDSGSAAPMGEDPSTPMQSTGQEGVIFEFGDRIMSAFSSALGMFQTFQGINRTHLQNIMQGITNEKEAASLFGSLSGLMLPESDHPDGIVNFDWKSQALNNARAFAKTLPKSLQQRFINYQDRFFNSAIGEGESFDAFRKRVISGRGNAIESQTLWSELSDVLLQITEPYAAATEKLMSSRQERELAENNAATAQAQNDETYANVFGENGGASKEALSDIAGFEASTAQNKRLANDERTIGILNGTIDEIIQNLGRTAKEGGIKGGLANLALVLMAGVRLWLVSQGAPNISKSSSQSHSLRQGAYGRSDSGSSSFSLSF